MFTHIPTGLRFNNRKEAKMLMGTSKYNRALKNREFTLHCNDNNVEDNNKNLLADNYNKIK